MNHQALEIHQAYQRGDLDALCTLLGDVAHISLESAIYHSPLPFIRTLLELGADPNYPDAAGFPSLIAAISTDRPDKHQIVELLLSFGADTGQRGVNDYTPLHYASVQNDASIVAVLLAHGADPDARTRIDDYTTPAEEAARVNRSRPRRSASSSSDSKTSD